MYVSGKQGFAALHEGLGASLQHLKRAEHVADDLVDHGPPMQVIAEQDNLLGLKIGPESIMGFVPRGGYVPARTPDGTWNEPIAEFRSALTKGLQGLVDARKASAAAGGLPEGATAARHLDDAVLRGQLLIDDIENAFDEGGLLGAADMRVRAGLVHSAADAAHGYAATRRIDRGFAGHVPGAA